MDSFDGSRILKKFGAISTHLVCGVGKLRLDLVQEPQYSTKKSSRTIVQKRCTYGEKILNEMRKMTPHPNGLIIPISNAFKIYNIT